MLYLNHSTERFLLIAPIKEADYNPLLDVEESLEIICNEILKIKNPLTKAILEKSKIIEEEIRTAVLKVNEYIISQPMIPLQLSSSFSLISHIIEQSYSRVISKPQLLNKYKKFSNEVYGEAKPEFVQIMLNDLHWSLKRKSSENQPALFIDLGSGVGTVALQMAAQTGCSAVGIEMRTLPAAYAKSLQIEFQSRMTVYRLSHGNISLIQGDFFSHPQILNLLDKADVIFANNVAFGPTVNTKLLDMFLCLKEGAKVVSLIPFAPTGMIINESNFHLSEAIFTVTKHEYPEGVMSWTSSSGYYYIHTVNRNRLKQFEAILHSSFATK